VRVQRSSCSPPASLTSVVTRAQEAEHASAEPPSRRTIQRAGRSGVGRRPPPAAAGRWQHRPGVVRIQVVLPHEVRGGGHVQLVTRMRPLAISSRKNVGP
jgi:hypothetical protein